jgi:nucleoside-diphosphate-sugar epimerase
MSGESFLVTGATGFIGAAVGRALVAGGFEVHGVSASGRPGPDGVTMLRCDLLAEQQVAALVARLRASHLIHCAWDVTHGVYWTAPTNLAWLAAGARLLQLFLAAGGRRAVGIGTCAEYSWTEGGIYTEGTTLLAPATPYGRCKLALGEAYEAARLMGASTAWARLFFPYGPGDGEARFLPSLLRSLRAGRPFASTSGIQQRDFIHVEDVGDALSALARSDVLGPVNIGTGEGPALREVALEAARAMRADPDLLRFGELPSRDGDPLALVADVTRLQREVGFTPRIGWREGVAGLAARS